MVATPYIMSTALDTYAKYVCNKTQARKGEKIDPQ